MNWSTDMIHELMRREREANIEPDPDLDIFYKVSYITSWKCSHRSYMFVFVFVFMFVLLNDYDLVGSLNPRAGGQCRSHYQGKMNIKFIRYSNMINFWKSETISLTLFYRCWGSDRASIPWSGMKCLEEYPEGRRSEWQ